MSDLQISLIVIGVTIIGGVCLYNWVQERNFRKRLDQAFGAAPDDVLLPRESPAGPATERAEPHLQPTAPAPRAAVSGSGATAAAREVAGPDEQLDCIAEIEAGAPIAEGPLNGLLGKVAACGR